MHFCPTISQKKITGSEIRKLRPFKESDCASGARVKKKKKKRHQELLHSRTAGGERVTQRTHPNSNRLKVMQMNSAQYRLDTDTTPSTRRPLASHDVTMAGQPRQGITDADAGRIQNASRSGEIPLVTINVSNCTVPPQRCTRQGGKENSNDDGVELNVLGCRVDILGTNGL